MEDVIKISKEKLHCIQFDDLKIHDYTADFDTNVSFATIIVEKGQKHKKTLSKRSDKYYYVIDGEIEFQIGDKEFKLSQGDFLFIPKGQSFSYMNNSLKQTLLCLIHNPRFRLQDEVFL